VLQRREDPARKARSGKLQADIAFGDAVTGLCPASRALRGFLAGGGDGVVIRAQRGSAVGGW